ncbi:MAG: hypothetical protein OXN97_13230 [Bryobacterales bacterium]|nr:hypothetical protein [Bryobacterales bacterium]
MSPILHMVRKDWRRTRLILCIWYPILILATALDKRAGLFLGENDGLQSLPTPGAEELEFGVIVFAGVLLGFLELFLRATIVSRVVQDDSTVGSTAFWLSRPVSARRLLASKAMLLLPAMVLPQIVVQLLVTYQLAGSPSTATEGFLLPVVSVAVFMMLAVLTPTLAGMAVLGGIMTGVIMGGFLVLIWLGMPLSGNLGLFGALTNELPLVFVLGVCVTVICHQYLTRRTRQSLVVAFSGILVFLLVLSGGWFLEAV